MGKAVAMKTLSVALTESFNTLIFNKIRFPALFFFKQSCCRVNVKNVKRQKKKSVAHRDVGGY